ncbi:MAG: hypothetical protein MUO39_00020 [Steroidobacteraceae bacterium]|nr:hypothetical protein [Steroidobacteraceae bacterium]
MDTSVADGTVIADVAVCVMPSVEYVAVIVAVPAFAPVTTPELLTNTTPAGDEEVTENDDAEVTSMVELLLNVPMTLSACVLLSITVAVAGETLMDVSDGCFFAFASDGWHPARLRPRPIVRASKVNCLKSLIGVPPNTVFDATAREASVATPARDPPSPESAFKAKSTQLVSPVSIK